MKKFSLLGLLAILALSLTSCEAAGTVFEAGKWYGIIIAVVIIGIFLFIFGRRSK